MYRPVNHGYIELVIGPMYSGKSEELIRRLKRAKIAKVLNKIWGLPAGFPGGSEVKASACNVGDLGSIPGLGRCPGKGNGNPLQYSDMEKSMGLYSPWGCKESDTTEVT